jgi:hypothetical protein
MIGYILRHENELVYRIMERKLKVRETEDVRKLH